MNHPSADQTQSSTIMSDDDYNSTVTFVNECMCRFRQAFFEADHAAMLAAMITLNGGTAAVLQTMNSPFTTEATKPE